MKKEFNTNAKITQQKRRVPLQLQKAVEQEINELLVEGQIRRVQKVRDEVLIQPVVITVQKDKSFK